MSTFALKLLAVLCMTLDHIGEYIPGAPGWFRVIGRLAAPLFMFCLVWGFDYTRDRVRYVKRVYMASVLYGCLRLLLSGLQFDLAGHNIFSTLFIILAFLMFIQSQHTWQWKVIIGMAWQGIGYILCVLTANILVQCVVANVFLCEGGVFWVTLGVVLYYIKNDNRNLIIGYTGICMMEELISMTAIGARIGYFISFHWPSAESIVEQISQLLYGVSYQMIPLTVHGLYLGSVQWCMIFALPFMLMYNHKKGRSWKYFFYVYYPLHLIVLSGIGIWMSV